MLLVFTTGIIKIRCIKADIQKIPDTGLCSFHSSLFMFLKPAFLEGYFNKSSARHTVDIYPVIILILSAHLSISDIYLLYTTIK